MSEVTTAKKPRAKSTEPRKVNPYTVIAIVTDADGNPIEGARIDVKVFSKNPTDVLGSLHQHRTSPGMVMFSYTK